MGPAPSVREPAVAGSFYPAKPATLRAHVEALLAAAPNAPAASPGHERRPKTVIAPHAGYVYSGASAARAFACLRPFADTIERVVILGPAHRAHLRGLAWPGTTHMRTPLGDVEVDVAALERTPGVQVDARAHALEHAIEVELPFVQVALPRAKVVPLAVGAASPSEVAAVLERLWGGTETAIVVSSDLSHYLPYDVGRALDEKTCARIAALDEGIDGEEACGAAGINGLLHVARARGLAAELVDLRSSGDVPGGPGGSTGSTDQVVGYAAFAFYEP